MLRHQTSSNIKKRIRIAKNNNYPSRLTRKEPPKRLKEPLEKFKHASPKNKEIIKEIFNKYTTFFKTNNQRKSQIAHKDILETLSNIDRTLEILRNRPISKDGREVHFLFPLTSMAGIGEFYKGYLEQALPKARYTFLVTPYTSSIEILRGKGLTNLKQNFERSVNINDRVFIVVDFISWGITFKRISHTIKDSFKDKKTEIYSINSNVEHGFLSSFRVYTYKDVYGKNVFSEHRGIKSKKEVENIKEREKAIKYTFYYLGWLTAMKRKAVKK